MSFASLPFVGLVAAGVILYYLVPKKLQWVVLLLASMVFYLAGGVKSAVWLVLVAAVTWLTGLLLARQNARPAPDKQTKAAVRHVKKRICAVCAVLCFGLLYLMKYWNFTASALPSALGDKLPRWDFVVPMGLSYFIFQAVGYVIDVYRGKTDAQKNPLRYGLFVSFFPQLIQGPIARFDQLENQLVTPHRFDLDGIERGLLLMLWGWFKKKVIADRALSLVEAVFGNQSAYGGAVIVVGVLFYSLQQYADFSGGIDLVTGIAQLFGIQLAPNFKRPYFSVSLGDFWRRWHISLGAWMRDYVFYPFALTRPVSRMSKALKKKAGTHIARALPAALGNILVFLLVGVWHGAQMNYVLWGLYNGVILAFTALVEPVYKRMNDHLPRLTASGGFHVFRILRTFLVVNIGWYFDRCVRVCDAFAMLHKTFFAFNAQQLFDGTLDTLGLAAKDYRILLIATIILFVVSLMQERGVKIRDFVLSRPLALRWAVLYAFIFFVLATFGGSNVAASGFMYAVF